MDKPSDQSADAALNRTLRSWKVETPFPPRFNEQVWKRVAAAEAAIAETSPWKAARLWLEQLTLKPVFAATYAIALVVLGIAGGAWHAQLSDEQEARSMSTRYVQMVDPYQMPRH